MTVIVAFDHFFYFFLFQLFFIRRSTRIARITVTKFSIAVIMIIMVTAWKVSVFGVFRVRIFPDLDWIWRDTSYYSVSFRIHSECRKIRTRKTPNTDTFHEVDDDDVLFLCDGWPMNGVKPYFQPTPLSKFLTIANVFYATSRIQACRQPEIRLSWKNFWGIYNQYYTAPKPLLK